MRALLRGLYQIATGTALAVAGPVLLARRGRHYLPTVSGRLGKYPPGNQVAPGPLWLHAVSVGEAMVAATLARALPPEIPLVVTTVTPTGQERARALLGKRPATEVAYLPFDLGFAVRRFFDRHEPRALVLVEGDYWPLLLSEARRRGLPVAVVNGRVGDRSYQRMLRLHRFLPVLFEPLFGRVASFGVQSGQDRERLERLGVPAARIAVTGNLKYESPEPERRPELEERLRGLAGGRPILLAGSTMPGEEEAVLDAFERLGGGGRALLALAPRHPERWDEVAGLLRARGADFARRSALPEAGRPAVLLLDSLGELAGLYRIAAAAFIGGTLAPKGGHNPLEPARFGVPVAVGPSFHNFREMAEHFDRADAWKRVAGAEELAAAWRGWIDDPAAAREQGARALRLLEENRGALDRTVAMLAPVLALWKS